MTILRNDVKGEGFLEMKKIKVYQNESYKDLGDLYGLFFEDINHAADGGLYAELVQNRSFEFCEIDRWDYNSLTAWEKSEDVEWEVSEECPLNKENTHYLKVKAAKGGYVRNLGFNTGIFVEEGKKYDFSVFAKAEEGKKIKVAVKDGEKICTTEIEITVKANEWTKYEAVMNASETTYNGRLYLEFEDGEYALDMVSMFPQDTFMGRKGGLRKDIAEALCEMKPKFMRFPGGCLTHDGSFNDQDRNSMYRWKRTLGKVEERPARRNNWGYNQTLGLGFYEYFCFCEDIGAKPLPVVPGAFNPHKGEGVPIEELGPWVQETLDLIEFANGSTDTPMGKVRAEMGHEAPFNLEYIGVGNEEIGDGFFERYPYFHNAIREKYPDIKIINTAGPFAVGEGYDVGWTSAKKYGSDIIDEHYYSSPEWFLANMHHYEDYDPNGPKVFLGEYASVGNTYYNALVEAAYMTHLERSRAVALACYAPMLSNVDYTNWRPDMLWFNNHTIMKTPNYYVQKMFMENQGTNAVKFTTENLDEIISLADKENLTGKLSIGGNDVEGKIWNIKLTDGVTGEVTSFADLDITDNSEHILGETNSKKYTLEFNFQRSKGRKGLKILFGKDEHYHAVWDFGGWDNWDCNIATSVNNRGSVISHRIFHVTDMEYTLKLEVDGRDIKTYINGEMWNNTTDRLPELEELYIVSSVDKNTNETILKVVNLTGDTKAVNIELDGDKKSKAKVVCLKGYELGAENSFDEPDKITPTESEITVNDNIVDYEFAPHSVNVLIFN